MNRIIELLKNAYKNSGVLFIIKLLGIGFNYLVLILILHFFGFKVNGEIANFIAQSKALMILYVFGLDVVLVKRINEDKKDIFSILLTSKTLLTSIVIISVIYMLFNTVFHFGYSFMLGGIVLAIWRYLSHFYRGKNNMVYYGFFEFIIFQITVIASIFISRFFEEPIILTILKLNTILVIMSIVYFLIRYFSHIKKHIVRLIKVSIFKTYKESFYFVLANSVIIIATALMYTLIKSNYSDAILGVYDTILKFSQVIVLPLIATNGRVMALTSKYFNKKMFKELREYIILTTKSLVLLSILATICVLVVFTVYSTYFKTELTSYWLLFVFLILAQLINNWAGPVGIVLQLTNNEKLFNKITLLSSAYLVCSTILIVRTMSIEYVALNYMIYMFIQNFLSLKAVKKKLNINPYNI